MNCNKCGAANDETSKCCGKCGHDSSKNLICPKCGKALLHNANFCVECGTRIDPAIDRSHSHTDTETKDMKLNDPIGAIIVSDQSLGFFTRMSTGKWLFVIGICIADLLTSMWNANLHPNINYMMIIFSDIFLVLIPYLIIAAYFFDFKREAHATLRNILLIAQIFIPAYMVWVHETNTTVVAYPAEKIGFDIMLVGWIEVVVLVIVKIIIGLRTKTAGTATR